MLLDIESILYHLRIKIKMYIIFLHYTRFLITTSLYDVFFKFSNIEVMFPLIGPKRYAVLHISSPPALSTVLLTFSNIEVIFRLIGLIRYTVSHIYPPC